MADLSYEDAEALFTYDPHSGALHWKPRARELFPTEKVFKRWNTMYAGRKAGWLDRKHGYICVCVWAKTFRAHRVCWTLSNGKTPTYEIDHINGVRYDNRVRNLRDIPLSENSRNRQRYVSNTSGVTGVMWANNVGKWKAQIGSGRNRRNLGYYDDFEDAVSARKAANIQFGFHQNHGRDATWIVGETGSAI